MKYTADEVFDYIEQEDVSFIRLAFCDVHGRQKNVSVMPHELKRAFEYGVSFDATAINGFTFDSNGKSDLLLFPIPSTLNVLPWRPSHGKVVRMFCNIKYPDGRMFEKNSRAVLENAISEAKEMGITVKIGSEYEFYLFKTDEDGNPTKIPFDKAGYMDVAPEDKGENVRREICLTLIDMDIQPECSHHEEGPGQNEIDFRYSDAMTAADNAMNFITVVKATATHNGLYADFSPKPLSDKPGNGLHINMSISSDSGIDYSDYFIAGILDHIYDMSLILNPCEESYARLGKLKAPKYISWAAENRSQLIRIPAASGEFKRFELRSPDPMANPYLAYAVLIYAGLDGIRRKLNLSKPSDIDLYSADNDTLSEFKKLPETYTEAVNAALSSDFISSILPFDVRSLINR